MRLRICVCLISPLSLLAQQGLPTTGASIPPAATPLGLSALNATPAPPRDYVLGPDDQISVWVADAADISGKATNIDPGGDITLPLVGRLRAAGLTTHELETELSTRLKKYFVSPQVVVSITEFRSQPVSMIGAVNAPGVHQLRGRKTLVEMFSMAGGVRNDAGYTVKITRDVAWGRIPLPGAKDDSTGRFSVAEISIKDIMAGTNPQGNILVQPNDVISVPRGELVYVIGEVGKAGGYVLAERQTMSVLQALALAGGLGPQAAGQNARILREKEPGAARMEIGVNVKQILSGKAKDVPLSSEDILFIPNNVPRKVSVRIAESALQLATGVAIFRSGR
jgi:polysaccharide export outer membrane protein